MKTSRPQPKKAVVGLKTGLTRATPLWHGKSLSCRNCFASQIAAAEAEKAKKAQECRQLQDKLVGDQPLTPERCEEIVNTMEGTGCTARLPCSECAPFPASPMRMWPMSTRINKPENDDPSIVEPLELAVDAA